MVIVLALLVLVTVSVLIELSVSSNQRSTSDNDASGTSAELVARTARESSMIGQLAREEIADGSFAVGTGQYHHQQWLYHLPTYGRQHDADRGECVRNIDREQPFGQREHEKRSLFTRRAAPMRTTTR